MFIESYILDYLEENYLNIGLVDWIFKILESGGNVIFGFCYWIEVMCFSKLRVGLYKVGFCLELKDYDFIFIFLSLIFFVLVCNLKVRLLINL